MLRSGHVSANMTGNIVLLGFGVAGGYHLSVMAVAAANWLAGIANAVDPKG